MIRPINNYISKHRYYELRHFCYQYHEWEKAKTNLKIFPGGKNPENIPDPTGDTAVKLEELESNIKLVNDILDQTDPTISYWLKMCVCDGKSYDVLQAYGVPCGKEYFYKRYKLFFYLLDKNR